MFTQPFHDFDTQNVFLSEGGPLAVVVGDFHETTHRTRDNADFPRLMRTTEARLRLAYPPSPGGGGAPHERAAGGESDPRILTASAASERVSRFTSQFTVNPLLGGRSHHHDPYGKTKMKTWTWVVLLNPALTAVGLQAWLSPWPCLLTPRVPRRPPTLGPGNATSRPSGHASARTGPNGRRPPRPGCGPHAPKLPRSSPGDGPSSAIWEYCSRSCSPRTLG